MSTKYNKTLGPLAAQLVMKMVMKKLFTPAAGMLGFFSIKWQIKN